MAGPYAYLVSEPYQKIQQVDLSTFSTVSASLTTYDTSPQGPTADPSGAYLYIPGSGAGNIQKVSVPSMASAGVVALPNNLGGASNISIDSSGSFAYVCQTGTLYKVPLSTFSSYGTALALTTTGGTIIDPSGTYLYVYGGAAAGYLTKISLSTYTVVGSPLAVSSYLTSMVIDPAGSYGYVISANNNSVTKVNLSTFGVVSTLALSSSYSSPGTSIIDNSGSYLYVPVRAAGGGAIIKIALSSFTAVALPLTVGNAYALAFDGGQSNIYCADYSTTSFHRVSVSSFAVVATATVTSAVTGVVIPFAPSAPSAPTLTLPTNASYQDVSGGIAFTAGYNSTDTLNQNAYAMRVKTSVGSYLYWNAVTSALQSTIVWNSDSVAVGGSWTVTFGGGVLTDGNVYNWSMASQESGSNLQGAFAADFTFTAQPPPSVVVNAPTGTEYGTTSPAVAWTDTLVSGASQTGYSIIVESGAFGTTPGSGTSAWASGVVSSTFTSVAVAATLAVSTTYRVFVQITATGGQTSAWSYSTFTLQADLPAVGILTGVNGLDSVTGAPMTTLTYQGADNILTKNDASFETSVGTWSANANCSVAQSSAQSMDGSYSLAATATAAGSMTFQTPYGANPATYPVVAGQVYTALVSFRAAATPRSCQVRLEFSAGTPASPTYTSLAGTAVTDSTTGWTQASVTFTAPSGAIGVDVAAIIAGCAASEVHYIDQAGIFPGTPSTWTDGGLAGTETVTFQFSDDNVNWFNVRNGVGLTVPPLGQAVIVIDYEGSLGFSRYYQATVTST